MSGHSGNEAWNSLCGWVDEWFPLEGIDEDEETCEDDEEGEQANV